MSSADTQRDARLAAIRLSGHADLLSVRQKTVVVEGLGTLGGPVVDHLAMLGVPLVLLDRGVVEPENLGTQGFAASQVGLSKVEARLQRVRQLNPASAVRGMRVDIEELGLAALQGVDVIVCCLDSFATRLVAHAQAWRLGLPWIDAALDGSGTRLYGRVTVYDPRQPEEPCILCAWDDAVYARVLAEQAGQQGCPTWLRALSQPQDAPPTLAISSMAGIIAGLQTLQTLRLLLGDTSVAGRELSLDAQHGLLHTAMLHRAPRCRFDHQIWPLQELEPGAWHQPVRELFTRAEAALAGRITLQPYRRTLATQLLCSSCGGQRPMAHFVHALTPEALQCPCGGVAQPLGFFCLERFDRTQAAAFLEHTWQQLGLPEREVITASNMHGQHVHYVVAA
jgi:adenylyltransferase/sulfurtransferase